MEMWILNIVSIARSPRISQNLASENKVTDLKRLLCPWVDRYGISCLQMPIPNEICPSIDGGFHLNPISCGIFIWDVIRESFRIPVRLT